MTTALITGASSGIGLELATLMAKEGINLILVARSTGKLYELAQLLNGHYNIQVDVVPADLANPNGVSALIKAVKGKSIDILVNNAGCGDYGRFQEVEWSRYQQTMMLNMMALTELSHAIVPSMIAKGNGQVVNVASTAAFQPLPWMAVYAATKSYVLSLSEAMDFELRDTGVRVLALCPGATKTGFANAADGAHSNNFADSNTASSKDVAVYAMAKINQNRGGVAVHGLRNRVVAILAPFSPKAIVFRMTDRVMRPQEPSSN